MKPHCVPFVSVIIPAHNEEENLRECLASLCAQNYPSFEIIVVDNGSTDSTQAVCSEFTDVRYIYYGETKSSYAARNRGVSTSSGEVLAFFDADQTAFCNYLQELLSEYTPDDHRHIYAGLLADDPRVPQTLSTFYGGGLKTARAGGGTIGTSCVAIPRRLFDELGGFKEELLSGADFEFFQRAQRTARVHRVDKPIGYHFHARCIGDFLRREERYSFGACLRARADGRTTPRLLPKAARLLWIAVLKLCAAAAVPLRNRPSTWAELWKTQALHIASEYYQLRGILRFHAGHESAGDLPATRSSMAAGGRA